MVELPTQKQKKEEFEGKFADLFDIAHKPAQKMTEIAANREFLTAQREK